MSYTLLIEGRFFLLNFNLKCLYYNERQNKKEIFIRNVLYMGYEQYKEDRMTNTS